ncbi:MAG: DUF935 domain-containing protein, partial [Pseudonocardia sp.]|nr:DUF935 domain-containing protein [Pseudonocardia sp.]
DEIVGGTPAAPAGQTSQALNRQEDPPAGDEIDELAEEMLKDWQPVMEEITGPIEALVEDCSSLEELMVRLTRAVSTSNEARLIDTLVKGMAKARALVGGAVGGLFDGTPAASDATMRVTFGGP